MAFCEGGCPSRFPRRTSPQKSHPPVLRATEAPHSKKRRLDESLSQDNEKDRDLSDSFRECTPECTSASPIETIEESRDLPELLKHQLQQAEAKIARLKKQSRFLKEIFEKNRTRE